MFKLATRLFLTTLALLFFADNLVALETEIRLVFFSDNAEIKHEETRGGLPALSTLLNQARQQSKNVVFLHGGSAIAPSTFSSFDRGAHMIDLLNQLEPTAFSIAKSELSYQEDELTLRSQEASFPLLSSNLFDPLTGTAPEGIEPFLIIDIDGFKIGILSIIDPELTQDYLPSRVTALDAGKMIDHVTSLLRSRGADIILLMTEYAIADAAELLAKGIVDILLVSDMEDRNLATAKGVHLEHGRGDSAALITLSLKRTDGHFSWKHQHQLVSLASYPRDSQVQANVNSYISQLANILEVEIGTTSTRLDTRKNSVRTSENAFGNLIADSIRSYYSADIGLMNGGGIRGNREYSAGTILTRGDIHKEMPFRNHVVNIRITGKQLREALENGLSRLEDAKGRFPHVSGLTVTYNPVAPNGSRVTSVAVGGKPLDPNKNYSLATINFLANGGDGYIVFKGCEQLGKYDSRTLLWEYVRDYIVKHKTISPVVEGRLKIVSD